MNTDAPQPSEMDAHDPTAAREAAEVKLQVDEVITERAG